jgi:hypothetical protein
LQYTPQDWTPALQYATHTLRLGDRPFGLAQYWTGNGGRFRELEAINPSLGALQSGPLPYTNWVVGFVLNIPPQWAPWQKAPPPTGL